MNKYADHLSAVLDLIHRVDRSEYSPPDEESVALTGLSGRKTVDLLVGLGGLFASEPKACYLEIGVFRGLTLASVARASRSLPCFGVDNFATLDPKKSNLAKVRERLRTLSLDNAHLIVDDYERAFVNLENLLGGRRIAVYFIDGPHDYRSQLMCLLHAKYQLDERAVIVVDDANYPDVRMATHDFLIANPDFRLAFDAYSPGHPANLQPAVRTRWEEGWLNGVHVIVRDPGGLLNVMLPPVDPDRTLYLNEWLVHRLRLAELAPEALLLADAVCAEDSSAEKTARATLLQRYAENRDQYAARFPDRNVMSAELPERRLNAFLK